MDDVRKRRRQRIQRIMNMEPTDPGRGSPDWLKQLEHERRLQEDPEYAWHHRRDPWKSASSRLEGMIRFQIAGAIVLFAAVWALFQWDDPSAHQGQAFVRAAFAQELQLEAAYAWYEARFGEIPSFIPVWDRAPRDAAEVQASAGRAYVAPVTGHIIEPFGGIGAGAGIIMRVTGGASVAAMDTGLVIYAGETQETGQTVVIRHPDGVETVYGYLAKRTVEKDQWVETGAEIGVVEVNNSGSEGGLLYFAVKKGNSFIDPAEVVAL